MTRNFKVNIPNEPIRMTFTACELQVNFYCIMLKLKDVIRNIV